MKTLFFLAVVFSGILAQPDVIRINKPDASFFGVAWNDFLVPQSFLVSSLNDGKVYKVDDRGNYFVFAESRYLNGFDDIIISSATGLALHSPSSSLMVGNQNMTAFFTRDFTGSKIASIVKVQPQTGQVIAEYDLTLVDATYSKALCVFDMVFDHKGDLFILDALSPRIFTLRVGAFKPQLLLREEEILHVGPNGIYSKGLAAVPSPRGSNLIFGNFLGQLFRATTDYPQLVTEIIVQNNEGEQVTDLHEIKFVSQIIWHPDLNAIAVSGHSSDFGSSSRTIWLQSTDDWRTATITNVVDSSFEQVTNSVYRDGMQYNLYGYFGRTGVAQYQLERIRYPSPATPYAPQPPKRYSCGSDCVTPTKPDINFWFQQLARPASGNPGEHFEQNTNFELTDWWY